MMVRDIMTTHPEAISASTSACDAAKKMKQLDVGGLPVERDDQVAGFVTDRDLVIRILAETRDPENTAVGDIMSEGLLSCKESDTLEEAADMMERQKVRRLIVTDDKDKMIGILSMGDVATRGNKETASEVAAAVSEPSHPNR